MKWLVISGFFVCILSYGESGALKCTLDSGDTTCRLEREVKVDIPKKLVLKEGKECAPGTHWKSQCNDCTCSPEGRSFCTEKGCIGQENEPLMQCAPDSTWSQACNTCWCTAEGKALCTKMGCLGTVEPNFDDSDEVSVQNRIASSVLDFPEIQDEYTNNLEEGHRVKRSVCKPSQSFPSECNTCKCASDGLSYHCTQNECMEQTDVDKEVEVFMENEGVDHIERTSVCQPQGTFYVGCNTCHCNYHGTDYSCTNKPCPLPEDVELFHELTDMKPIIPYKDEEKSIKVKKEFKPNNKTKTIVCAANRMFIKNCNTCWCNEDGTGYFCTRKVCTNEFPKPEDPAADEEDLHKIEQKCHPDEIFELNCNTCRCNPEGTSYSCTRKGCEDEARDVIKVAGKTAVEINVEKKLPIVSNVAEEKKIPDAIMNADNVPDDVIVAEKSVGNKKIAKENTNNMKVSEKSFAGIQLAESIPSDVEVKKNISDDVEALKVSDQFAVAERDVKDKNATHSRKVRGFPPGPPRACQPGLEFRMDCNTCLCNNEGRDYSCTRIDCAASAVASTSPLRRKRDIMKEIEVECAAGSVFEQGCKVCRCSADGKHATCTQRHCDKQADADNNVDASPDNGFRCSPGEQFKRACNDCTCSADGKSVFCTLRLCDSDITPTT